MRRTAFTIILGCLACLLAPVAATPQEQPEELTPRFWAVTGVASNDVLHLRDVPSAESKSLAGIPPNTHGLKNLGCRRNQVPFDQWVRMSESQRNLAMTRWCRVEYRGMQGWVAGRYLKDDDRSAR